MTVGARHERMGQYAITSTGRYPHGYDWHVWLVNDFGEHLLASFNRHASALAYMTDLREQYLLDAVADHRHTDAEYDELAQMEFDRAGN